MGLSMTKKLVRDKVDAPPWQYEKAKVAFRLVHSDAEFLSLLERKLLEEVGELLAADTEADAIEEAGDVLEVMLTYLARCGDGSGDLSMVVNKMLAKRQGRGGFERGLVLDLR